MARWSNTAGRVYTATQAQDDAIVAYLFLQLSYGRIDKRSGTPALAAATDVNYEILQHLCAVLAMEHFGMELYAPHIFALGLIGSDFHLVGRSDDAEVIGDSRDGIAVAHPHLRILAHVLEEHVALVEGAEVGTSVFACTSRFNLTAVAVRDELGAVADTQNGILATQLAQVHLKSALVVDGERAAREDDSLHTVVALRELVVGHNLTVNIQFADAAADELRSLRSEIENDDFFLHICVY